MVRSKAKRASVLVVRSGETRFGSRNTPEIELVERSTHSIASVPVDSARIAGPFDLTVFTSRPAVGRFFDSGRLVGLLGGDVLAVGPATAAAVRSRGWERVRDAGGSATRILGELPAEMTGLRVLLPRGDDASDELPRELARRGAEVVALVLYRKKARRYHRTLDDEILAGRFGVVLATSPSAARWLLEGAGAGARETLRRTPWVVLGPSTCRSLEKRGVDVVAIAAPPTFESAARLAASLAAQGPGK